jgi:hypothetical protein
MTSGSNCRHLNRPQTEDARSIGQAYQLKPPNLQHFQKEVRSIARSFITRMGRMGPIVRMGMGDLTPPFSAPLSHTPIFPSIPFDLFGPSRARFFLLSVTNLRLIFAR